MGLIQNHYLQDILKSLGPVILLILLWGGGKKSFLIHSSVSPIVPQTVRKAEVCLAACLWGQMDRITYVLNKSEDIVVFPLSGQTSKRRCWVISLFFYFSIFSQPRCDGDRLGTRHTVMVNTGPGLWNWM